MPRASGRPGGSTEVLNLADLLDVDGVTGTGTTAVLSTGPTLDSPVIAKIVGARGADIASASTINLTTATGDPVDVTGTTTITAITLADGVRRTVRFTGALTLTHGASLVLPSAANIVTAAGDYATFQGYASGVVRCVSYEPADGEAIIGSGRAYATFLVKASGGDYTTLSAAIAALPAAGGRIVLAGETFAHDPVTLPAKPVDIVGQGNSTILSLTGANALFTVNDAGYQYTFRNFRVSGDSNASGRVMDCSISFFSSNAAQLRIPKLYDVSSTGVMKIFKTNATLGAAETYGCRFEMVENAAARLVDGSTHIGVFTFVDTDAIGVTNSYQGGISGTPDVKIVNSRIGVAGASAFGDLEGSGCYLLGNSTTVTVAGSNTTMEGMRLNGVSAFQVSGAGNTWDGIGCETNVTFTPSGRWNTFLGVRPNNGTNTIDIKFTGAGNSNFTTIAGCGLSTTGTGAGRVIDLQAGSAQWTITGNTIYGGAMTECIQVASDSHVITGNTIYGDVPIREVAGASNNDYSGNSSLNGSVFLAGSNSRVNGEIVSTVATTDATVTTLQTLAIAASTTYFLETVVVARRTGGASGTADDGAQYLLRAMVTTKAGTVTIANTLADGAAQEDQAAWDCAYDVSTTNVRVRVTGAAGNNVTWMAFTRLRKVPT